MSGQAIVAALVLGLAAPGSTVVEKESDVLWNGRRYATDELPEALPEDARVVVSSWAVWAREHEYRFLVDDDGLLVVVCPVSDGEAERRLELAERTAAAFDEHLPTPDRPEPAAVEEEPDEDDEEELIPEDPEGDEPLFDDVTVERDEPWSYEWGAGTRPLDTGAIAVFACKRESDYRALVDELGQRRTYLGEWAEDAKAVLGFAIEDPLVGAFALGASGLEEWDPHGELVHRVADLLMLRRYGRQPYWVLKGWAWWSELAIRGAIYVFPYRDGFVGVGEHGGWDHLLRNRFGKRGEQPTMADITSLTRGRWDDFAAGMALGTVTCLVDDRPEDFIQLLEQLRRAWDRDSRIEYPDGTWERDRDFRLTARQQQAIFERVLGADV